MLLNWLSEVKLERVGCFKYEPVQGAAANDLGLPLVPPEEQERRWHRFMAHQQGISAKLLQRRVGKRIPVIIDEAKRHCRQGGAPSGTRRRSTAPFT